MKLKGVFILFFGLTIIMLFFMFIFRACSGGGTDNTPEIEKKQKRWLLTTTELLDVKTSSDADTVAQSFKKEQMANGRVKKAYKEKLKSLKKLLSKKEIISSKIDLYLVAYKEEQILEVWAKEKISQKYAFIKSYPICKSSGTIGPKRKEGDKQTPEGFYKIIKFNPLSKYEFSLQINYPNRSDNILGDTTNIGGDIFIQGGCKSVGGIPIQNKNIKELYVLAVEAKASAVKSNIPITIYPAKMTDDRFKKFQEEYAEEKEILALWTSLKKGYDFFQKCKELPNIVFNPDGTYKVSGSCK